MKRNEVAPIQLGSSKREAPTKNYRDPKNWPPSLQEFITRCFTKSNELNFTKELKDQFQLQLKKIIDKAIEENKVEENDWKRQKLPIFDYSFKKLELICNLNPQASNDIKATRTTKQPALGIPPIPTALPKRISMKIAKPKTEETLRPSPLQQQKRPLESSAPIVSKQQSPQNLSEKALKKQRMQRFRTENAKLASPSPEPVLVRSTQEPLVGTCQNLEKNYLRLTSEPQPELVRPLPVLRKTLKLLKSKYEKEKNYNYLKNQLKSLRQDLTVQHIKNKFTIKLYEFHSKMAIEFKDLGEFNQCQSQLKQLYQLNLGINRNKYEFLSYRILYFIITRDFTALSSLKLSLIKEKDLMNNEFIILALKLWDYTLTNNYHDFFKLLQSLIEIDNQNQKQADDGNNDGEDDDDSDALRHSKFHYFTKMVQDFIVERQLLTTFSILSRSYKKLSTKFIESELFANNSLEMESFLTLKELSSFVEGEFFEFAKARNVINELLMGTRKIDIKGQI